MRYFYITHALLLVGLAAVSAAVSPSESGDGFAIHGVVFSSTSQLLDRFNSTSPLLVDSDSSLQLMHHSGVSPFGILETRLQKRAPTITAPVIEGAAYYREKQHSIQADSNDVFDGEQARKRSENGHKAEAVISNLPIKSQQIVNDYEGKIKLAQRMIRSGLGNQKIRGDNSMTWNEKHQDWVDKKPHWEQRTSQLEKDMAEKQEAGTFVLRDPKAEAQVSAYNMRRLDRSRNPWQHLHVTTGKRLAKRGLVPSSPVQSNDGNSPKPLDRHLHRRDLIRSAVEYYEKADRHDVESDKWKHNQLKADGARYNDPKYTESVLDSYQQKVKKANEGWKASGHKANHLYKKLYSWEEHKIPAWEQRRDHLMKEGKPPTDPKVEKEVMQYFNHPRPEWQPNPKYDLPKKPVIHHAVHYLNKAEGLYMGRKWEEAYKKYSGARHNNPVASQYVVDLYHSKIEEAKKKRDTTTDPFEKAALDEKITRWESLKPQWEARRDHLAKEKERKTADGTYSDHDKEVEKAIHEYENPPERPQDELLKKLNRKRGGKRHLRKRALVPEVMDVLEKTSSKISKVITRQATPHRLDRSKHQQSIAVVSSPTGYSRRKRAVTSDSVDDSPLQKRAGAGIRNAVDYVRKGDHYDERFKASGGYKRGDKALLEKKKQNREKGWALRTNEPRKTAIVIARYTNKLASATDGSGRPASSVKIHQYKEKKSRFEERHAMLVQKEKEEQQAGTFEMYDPYIEEEVAKYHRGEYRPYRQRMIRKSERKNAKERLQEGSSKNNGPAKKSKTAGEDMMDVDFVPRNVIPRPQESQVHNHIPKTSDGPIDLRKRAPPVLRSAVDYIRKETKYDEALKHSPNDELLKDKKEQNHEKQQALRSRNSIRTFKVINRLDGKIQKTSDAVQEAGRSDPELVEGLKEKLASYTSKKPLWQARHAELIEYKARTGQRFIVHPIYPKVEKEVQDYYKNEHPYRKLALQPFETDRKSHADIHSAVHYYKKAIEDKSDDQRRKAAILKAEGARFKHPEYSQKVMDHYESKLSQARLNGSPSVGGPYNHDKYLLWQKKKTDWTQRRDDLARDMIQKIDKGEAFSMHDEKVEEQLKIELPKHLRADSAHRSEENSGQIKDVSEGLHKRLQKRAITPDVKLQEEVTGKTEPYVIKDAIHYYEKADTYPDRSAKWLEHRLKAAGARFKNPLSSGDVVRMYERKIEAAEKQLKDGKGDGEVLRAKMKEWREKRIPAWEARKALMEVHKAQNADTDRLWYKDPEVELRYKAYEEEKAARQAAAKIDEASTSEKRLEKRGAIKSPVEYYKKADVHGIDSQKWHHNLLKATGARYNDPSYSNDVVRSYNGKMEGLREQLRSMKGGTPESAVVVKKMLSHDAKIGNWEQRRDNLRKKKAAKDLMGTYTIRDEETEKKVQEYQTHWQAKPFTFPDPKYDLPKQGGMSVVKSVPEYFLKGKQLRDSRFRDSWIDKESERKYREIIKKAAGARYNDPEFSQRVVDMYKSKIDDAQNKILEGKEDAEALKKKVPLWEHIKLPEWKYRHDMLELQKAEQDSKGTFRSFNPDVEKTISDYHTTLRKPANQPRLPASQPLSKRGIVDELQNRKGATKHLEKRGVIKDPVHYYQKGDGQDIDSSKWQHSQLKATGARYNEPSFSQEVVHSYTGKLEKERKHLKQVKAGGPEWNASMWKILSCDSKMKDWEQRRSALRQAKVAKERRGTYSVNDDETERKVEEYQRNWRPRPFTFPDPKYDLPIKQAAHGISHSNASPETKNTAIKTVPHYWQKTKKHVMEGMDGGKWVNPESERKHGEAMMKGNGARFNDPKFSQRVVDLYKDKVNGAEVKMRGEDKDTEVLKKKVTAWKNTDIPEWERRLKWLKIQKGVQDRSGTFQSFDPVVEKTISDYLSEEKKRTAHSRVPASQHPHVKASTHLTKRGVGEVADTQVISRDEKQVEPQLQKRTIDAVRFMKKGDQIAKRPANTGMERAKKNKKWMENLNKTQGARYNTPADSARVVDLYEGKLTQARKKAQWISRAQGDTEELEVKMRKWDQETIPSWQHRRARLASEMHSKLSTGQFQARDPKTELAIERYEEAKRAQRLKRKRIQKKKLRMAAAARSQDRDQDQGAGPSKKPKVEPKDEP